MFYHSNLVRLMYLITFLAELSVLCALFHRRLQRTVRWFTAFILFVLARDLVVYPLYETIPATTTFFYVNWLLEAVATLVISGFLIELMGKTLANFMMARRVVASALIVAAITLVVIAILTIPYGASYSYATSKAVMVTERSVRMVQVGVIIVFFALARYLALSLKNFEFGILLGFGLYAASNLAVAAFNAEVGGIVAHSTMLIDSTTYICMYLIWLYYILKQEPESPPPLPPTGRDDLEQWNRALSDLNNR